LEKAAKSIKVMIVDDHPVVRIGLQTMLDSENDIVVVGMAGSAREAIIEAEKVNPDVVLMDLRMPEMDGNDAIIEMRRIQPGMRILVLTNYQEDEYISKAFHAGAMGYLLKCTPQEEIVKAVHTLYQNRRYVPADIAQRLMESIGREKLSERELEVLKLVAEGLSNKEIAQKLSISDKTARNHVTNCLIKLGANDRTEAATTAIKRGLIRIAS
jgi:DNA-binding NarL/FixJ family response regulator